jgi:O-antigen/teichoic acid export membrane protein
MTHAAPAPESTSAAADSARASLRGRVISGSVWTIASYGASQVLRLAGNVVFAKLLSPEGLGLMLLVSIFVQGLTMFSDIGIGPSIIQSRRGEELAYLNTAWTIQVARGVLLWIVSLIGAAPFATWYGQPQLSALVPVAAMASIISGFTSTKLFSSNRKIALARITLLDFASQTLGLVTMVVWCFVSRTVWAIVFGGLVGTTAKMVLSHVALQGERNGFKFERAAVHELTTFGRWIFLSTSLSFLTSQVDRLMLGKFVPIGLLGVYSMATNLASLPPMVTLTLTGGVLFPLLAHHSRTNAKEYERALFAARRVILEGALFLLAGLALLSPAFFRILYDQRYSEATWMTQVLIVPMWIWMLMISADRAVLAVGESRTLAVSNAASLLVKIVACILGYHIAGLAGFILGLALGNLAGHVPIVLSLRRRGTHILKQDLAYTAVAVSSVGGALLVQRWAVAELNVGWRTWVEIAVAAVVLVPLGLRVVKNGRQALSRR